MKIKIADKYYLEKFINLYEDKYNDKVEYDDEVGIYKFNNLGFIVRAWNFEIRFWSDVKIPELIYFISNICESYYFDYIELEEVEHE